MGIGNQHLVFERYLWIDGEIRKERYPNARCLAEEFEISKRTAQRNIEFMRNNLNAPLFYDPARRGYTYETPFSLPELPLSQKELLAVLLVQSLISSTDNGYLAQAVQVLGKKLFQKNGDIGIEARRIIQCFSALWHGYAPCDPDVFQPVSQALLSSRLLSIRYSSPNRNKTTSRTIEPHHLQHYMGSWVLLAWCRLRKDWRRFYLSRMKKVKLLDEPFERRPASTWRPLIKSGFGIFQGPDTFKVTIRFSPLMAKWVREQVWHPDQKREECRDGSLILTVPAADLREIKMKVMQFGAEAEVLAPEELKEMISEEAKRLLAKYLS